MKLLSPFTRIILIIQFAFAAYKFIKRMQSIRQQPAPVKSKA